MPFTLTVLIIIPIFCAFHKRMCWKIIVSYHLLQFHVWVLTRVGKFPREAGLLFHNLLIDFISKKQISPPKTFPTKVISNHSDHLLRLESSGTNVTIILMILWHDYERNKKIWCTDHRGPSYSSSSCWIWIFSL